MTDTTSKRIQRQRTKGWRMPECAVYVGRPTKFGNPWKMGDWLGGRQMSRAEAVAHYRYMVGTHSAVADAARRELRGKDLACWCPLDQPCHADVLLELANTPQEP